jgi:hypothetical protein
MAGHAGPKAARASPASWTVISSMYMASMRHAALRVPRPGCSPPGWMVKPSLDRPAWPHPDPGPSARGGRSACPHPPPGTTANAGSHRCGRVRQVVYLTEDAGAGKFHRIRPNGWGDLSSGVLEAAVGERLEGDVDHMDLQRRGPTFIGDEVATVERFPSWLTSLADMSG